MARTQTKTTSSTLEDVDKELDTNDLNISEERKERLKQLDYNNQLAMVRALREKQELENYQSHPSAEALKREASALHKAMQSKTEQEPKEQTNQQSDEKEQIPTSKDDNINKDNIIKQIGNTYYSTLAMKESSNNYKKRLEDGLGIGAIGKYQFRTPALKETGYMDSKGNFTGKDGIKSINDFLNNPEIQEKAIREFTLINYNYMKHYKVLSMIGLNIDGIKEKFPITLRGMLAASHKEGGPMTAKYLNSLEKNKNGNYYLPYNKYQGAILRSFKAIETRLREFSKLSKNQ